MILKSRQGLFFSQLVLSNFLWDGVFNKNLSEISFGKHQFYMKILDYPSTKSVLRRLKCTKFAAPRPPSWWGGAAALPKNPTPVLGPSASIFGPSGLQLQRPTVSISSLMLEGLDKTLGYLLGRHWTDFLFVQTLPCYSLCKSYNKMSIKVKKMKSNSTRTAIIYSTTLLRLRNPTPVHVSRTLSPPNFRTSFGVTFSEPSWWTSIL